MPLPPLPDPDGFKDRHGGLLRATPALLGLGTSLLGLNAAQIASLVIRPVSGTAFRKFNRGVADRWWGWTVDVARGLHGAEVVVTGDDVPAEENAIVVANHQQMPDITFLMQLARARGRLGDMKWMLKHVIKYVPGVGWGLNFLDAVFMKRDWMKDQANIDATFAHLHRNDVPMWLMLFPEGTRIQPHKLERAQAFARERDLPAPHHVLMPRTKGFVAAVSGLRGHVQAIYDVTIGYEEGVPTLRQFMGGLSTRAHLHVRRWPLADLPTDDVELAAWLLDRWRDKDALLDGFYERGAFPGPPVQL